MDFNAEFANRYMKKLQGMVQEVLMAKTQLEVVKEILEAQNADLLNQIEQLKEQNTALTAMVEQAKASDRERVKKSNG